MSFKKIIIALALLLTIFAIDAKAITCTPPPPGCPSGSTTKMDSITISLPGPGGSYNCKYRFCYCYACPDSSIPNDPIKIYMWNIEATSGCELVDKGLLYDMIQELLTSPNYDNINCGPIPPCIPLPSHFKYVEYRIPACWHGEEEGAITYFRQCPNCTAECITLYRFCIEGGFIHKELVGNTLVGDINCDPNCPLYGFGPGDNPPPDLTNYCWHVCH